MSEHSAEKDAGLIAAVKDVCWRAQRYGATEDGDTAYYLVTKGAMHRLVAACPGAAFRSDDSATIPDRDAEIVALRAAGYHVMRQGTWDNHTRELAVLRNENRWLREEKEHHEKWLAGILDESRRLQDRFNRITAAMALSGVEWSTIADLLGDES